MTLTFSSHLTLNVTITAYMWNLTIYLWRCQRLCFLVILFNHPSAFPLQSGVWVKTRFVICVRIEEAETFSAAMNLNYFMPSDLNMNNSFLKVQHCGNCPQWDLLIFQSNWDMGTGKDTLLLTVSDVFFFCFNAIFHPSLLYCCSVRSGWYLKTSAHKTETVCMNRYHYG